MTEPFSTGIGGDIFCLFYDAKTKKVNALNGSGRAAGNVTLEKARKALDLAPGASGGIPMSSALAITVPGAAAGWVDAVTKFGSGKLSLEQILKPAIELADEGFPVSELTSHAVSTPLVIPRLVFLLPRAMKLTCAQWQAAEDAIRKACSSYHEMLKEDPQAKGGARAPRPGEIFKSPTLARTFRALATEGKDGFYRGRIAQAITKTAQDLGGFLTADDLANHADTGSQGVEAISMKADPTKIAGEKQDENTGEVEVWEHPPNGQGIVALMALGILKELSRSGKIPHFTPDQHNSVQYLHAVIESLRIALADGSWWVTDPDVEKVPSQDLVSEAYLAERAKLFDPNKTAGVLHHGSPAHNHSDTVYFAVTDKEGNGMSFINSVYGSFGTGIVPEGCGFTLQNRGAGFSLTEGHPNVIAPGKRPFHTIIPAMVTNPADNSLHTVFGVMGGFMQPQGHVQVLLNMLGFRHSPQAALDAPRFCIGAGHPGSNRDADQIVYLEEGISESVARGLEQMGHKVKILGGFERNMFGRGQTIRCHHDGGRPVYSAGSDQRGDGGAYPV